LLAVAAVAAVLVQTQMEPLVVVVAELAVESLHLRSQLLPALK
jgi:hypothetical protein